MGSVASAALLVSRHTTQIGAAMSRPAIPLRSLCEGQSGEEKKSPTTSRLLHKFAALPTCEMFLLCVMLHPILALVPNARPAIMAPFSSETICDNLHLSRSPTFASITEGIFDDDGDAFSTIEAQKKNSKKSNHVNVPKGSENDCFSLRVCQRTYSENTEKHDEHKKNASRQNHDTTQGRTWKMMKSFPCEKLNRLLLRFDSLTNLERQEEAKKV